MDPLPPSKSSCCGILWLLELESRKLSLGSPNVAVLLIWTQQSEAAFLFKRFHSELCIANHDQSIILWP